MQPKVIKNGHTYTHTYPDDTSSNMLLEDISQRTNTERETLMCDLWYLQAKVGSCGNERVSSHLYLLARGGNHT